MSSITSNRIPAGSTKPTRKPVIRLADFPMGDVAPQRVAPPPKPDADEERQRGQHWGGFWPFELVPEFDADEFIPTPLATNEQRRDDQEVAIARKAGPFKICNAAAVVVRVVDERWRAIGCLTRQEQGASFVLQAGKVVLKRGECPIVIGSIVRPDESQPMPGPKPRKVSRARE
jgi:hypothetical protein